VAPSSVVDRPFDYSRTDLLTLYEMLETIRNESAWELEATKKTMRRFGMEFPSFAIQQVKFVRRASEVLMSTIGAGIAPERRDDVRQIWSILRGSYPYLAQAILGIREVEQRTAAATGAPASMYNDIDTKEWLDACRFIPSSFSRELGL
jgi:hypothetical protein